MYMFASSSFWTDPVLLMSLVKVGIDYRLVKVKCPLSTV
jgi:hypothetical protein